MSPDVMLTIIKIAAIFIAVSFVVFWVGLVWWVSQDVLTRTKDKIIISAAVGLTAILGPVGILIYLVVRPRQTLKERFGEMMEQEMMLQASAITICPKCERMAQDDFLACPHCGTTLKKPCRECSKLLAMDWDHCPFCGTSQQPASAIEAADVIVVESVQPTPAEIEVAIITPTAPKTKPRITTKPVIDLLRQLFAPVGQAQSLPDLQLDDQVLSAKPTPQAPKASPAKKPKSSPKRRVTAKKDKHSAKKH